MDKQNNPTLLLEQKVIALLNKLKELHLEINLLSKKCAALEVQNESLHRDVDQLKEENKSLKIANNLLGSNEGKTITKTKINNLIKEVDLCINQLSNI